MKRRQFVQGCCAGIAAVQGARVTNVAFGAPGTQRDVLVVLFQRGGMDALSFLVPHSDADYHGARADLGLSTAQVIDLNGQFGLHPRCTGLKQVWDAGHLALIPAAGSTNSSRSHFEAQDAIERGTPDDAHSSGGGWLGRHLKMVPSDAIFTGVSQGSSIATSLTGFSDAIALTGASGFTLQGSSGQRSGMRRALRAMYQNDAALSEVGLATLDATDIVEYAAPGNYTPQNGASYGFDSAGQAFASVAQLIRLDLGLQAATIDLGGWDTHESQADNGSPQSGDFANKIEDLSDALRAFWTDLTDYHGRLTVVVMTEFGRRLKENNNRGTDHGRGGVMIVMSGSFRQPGLHGQWLGLSNDALFERVDVPVLNDYRTILSEILIARLANDQIYDIFPDFDFPGAMGLFLEPGEGPPPPPDPPENAARGWSQYS